MSDNPYQPPIFPPSGKNLESDSAVSILAEMRDMQRESLAISRSNAAVNKFAVVAAMILLVLVVLAFVAVVILKPFVGRNFLPNSQVPVLNPPKD